jgi:hypothetical protein
VSPIDGPYYIALLVWLASFAVFLAQAWAGRYPVVGISLAYWLDLAMIHLLGGVVQLLPWHASRFRADTITGFQLTGYAMAGLLLGNMLVTPFLPVWLSRKEKLAAENPPTLDLGLPYIVMGLAAFFIPAGLLRSARSLGAILSGGLSLAVGGFCLLWWQNWMTGRGVRAWFVLLAAFILPILTLVLQGFLGSGVCALASLGLLVAVYYRPRAIALLLGVATLFGGLSLYQAYTRGRVDIRRAVWGGENYDERIRITYSSLEKNWAWLDSHEHSQLNAIEERLNQNYLLGVAHQNLSQNRIAFGNGETFLHALLALVPRIVWPDKPTWAGSGDLVTRFTGIRFAAGTSVGIGHVMELYVNFGEIGLLLGYILLGAVLRWMDTTAGVYLRAGDAQRFISWFVSGQALLGVQGNFAEMTAAAAAYTVLCIIANAFANYCRPHSAQVGANVRVAGTKGMLPVDAAAHRTDLLPIAKSLSR